VIKIKLKEDKNKKMFGKNKKKQEQGQSAVINPVELPELPPQQFQPLPPIQEIQGQAQQQPVYQEQVQPVQQPVQPVQPVQVQQPVQQPPQPTAYIVQAAVVEPGVFRYVIDTNYPLAIGDCSVTQ